MSNDKVRATFYPGNPTVLALCDEIDRLRRWVREEHQEYEGTCQRCADWSEGTEHGLSMAYPCPTIRAIDRLTS